MPELPEVETILQGIKPWVQNQRISHIEIRQRRLRFEIPANFEQALRGQIVHNLTRRGKYLLFHTASGTAIFHFGMSGSLAILQKKVPAQKHDHVDLFFDDFYLRFTDPRRFGAILWTKDNPLKHPLLANLGVEPLGKAFNENYLYQKSRNKKINVKQFIMNSAIVVGVGNIYAAEALFLAKIHPLKPCNTLNLMDYQRLCQSIKQVLRLAIKKGGTTIRNFVDAGGKPGYFKQALNVYGRSEKPCKVCQTPLENIRIQNRATVYCPFCQPSALGT